MINIIDIDYSLKNFLLNLEDSFDSVYGGFKETPKKPKFSLLYILLKISTKKDLPRLKEFVLKSLLSIYKGGIFDHVEYGFFDYSISNNWLIPKFKKTLEINALALLVYSEAFKVTKNSIYKDICNNIFDFLKINFLKEDSLFISSQYAEDANSEDYFLFSYSDFNNILKEDSLIFSIYYDLTEKGNYKGKNILNLIDKDLDLNGFFDNKKDLTRKKLLQFKANKKTLITEEKISFKNNSLLSFALLEAYSYIGNKDFLNLGKKIIDSLINSLALKSNENEDYSFLILALSRYYEISKDSSYIALIDSFIKNSISDYYDKEIVAFKYPLESMNLSIDETLPDFNSIMLIALIEANKFLNNSSIKEIIETTLSSLNKNISIDLIYISLLYRC